ncbi:hypothetical protein [Bradyrhizobium neotropicale]|uniref:hypothetical protein n=1 Tax=Bradyrhizobium neotropicale TaxID=1497615 RepID=UPI001AD7616D|nr:hypothetical protein [Bradyrhizobium neotropicale]MBO4228450.1 hypothetical protein [Bradyrhizobium neotropicale]
MTCENQVGVKNILLTFKDCDTDAVYGPISHLLSSEDLPTWRLCPYNNDPLPHGYVKRQPTNPEVEIKVIRDLRIPLSMYQGCSDVTLQVEYYNGLVYSAAKGTGTGDDKSDTHEVTMTISFKEIDEMLPNGLLESTSEVVTPTFAPTAAVA